jgi:ABC-type phosphate/phosphonate transport system permease subunit
MRQWTFLLGPGLIPRINAPFLGYVMYRSRLVPRLIPAIGLVGAPLILASATGTIFGAWDHSTIRARGPCRSPCGNSASAST